VSSEQDGPITREHVANFLAEIEAAWPTSRFTPAAVDTWFAELERFALGDLRYAWRKLMVSGHPRPPTLTEVVALCKASRAPVDSMHRNSPRQGFRHYDDTGRRVPATEEARKAHDNLLRLRELLRGELGEPPLSPDRKR
jgi:hypothetical protein